MKKLQIIVMLLIIAFPLAFASAQSASFRFGVNLSKILYKEDGTKYDEGIKLQPGFHIGFLFDNPIGDVFSIEPGLLINTKGFMVKEEITTMGYTQEASGHMNLIYADIPILAKVNVELGGGKIYAGLGPYVGVGLFGWTTFKTKILGETDVERETVDWGTDEISRLDLGLYGTAGYEINRFMVGIFYQLGLWDIDRYSSNDKTLNRVFGVSLGLKLGDR